MVMCVIASDHSNRNGLCVVFVTPMFARGSVQLLVVVDADDYLNGRITLPSGRLHRPTRLWPPRHREGRNDDADGHHVDCIGSLTTPLRLFVPGERAGQRQAASMR